MVTELFFVLLGSAINTLFLMNVNASHYYNCEFMQVIFLPD